MALGYSQLGTDLPSHLSPLCVEPGKVCGLLEEPSGDKVKWEESRAVEERGGVEDRAQAQRKRGCVLLQLQEEMAALPAPQSFLLWLILELPPPFSPHQSPSHPLIPLSSTSFLVRPGFSC